YVAHLAADASRSAALLVGYISRRCALLAPYASGASTPICATYLGRATLVGQDYPNAHCARARNEHRLRWRWRRRRSRLHGLLAEGEPAGEERPRRRADPDRHADQAVISAVERVLRVDLRRRRVVVTGVLHERVDAEPDREPAHRRPRGIH